MGADKKPPQSPVNIAHTHALLEFMNAAWTPYHAVGAPACAILHAPPISSIPQERISLVKREDSESACNAGIRA
jgi:hypothetical protein